VWGALYSRGRRRTRAEVVCRGPSKIQKELLRDSKLEAIDGRSRLLRCEVENQISLD
jgi:hypothetical protein